MAQVARGINNNSQDTGLRVSAYVGNDLDPCIRAKFASGPPSSEVLARELGLDAEHCLGLYGDPNVLKPNQSHKIPTSKGNIGNPRTQVCMLLAVVFLSSSADPDGSTAI